MTQPEEAADGSGVSRITASERELLLPPLRLPSRTRQPVAAALLRWRFRTRPERLDGRPEGMTEPTGRPELPWRYRFWWGLTSWWWRLRYRNVATDGDED
jgi:hypothetical protein